LLWLHRQQKAQWLRTHTLKTQALLPAMAVVVDIQLLLEATTRMALTRTAVLIVLAEVTQAMAAALEGKLQARHKVVVALGDMQEKAEITPLYRQVEAVEHVVAVNTRLPTATALVAALA
jgi:Ni,Fe-hydrogenase III small subunit